MLKFKKRLIDKGTFEAASVFDVDGDGIPDIVCGGYWYKGPDFTQKFFMCDVMPADEYFDDFSDFPLDVNGDGKPDVITGGWWGKRIRWRENNGINPWPVHELEEYGSIETTRFYDIDGCGTVEVVPNTPGMPQCFYKLENNQLVQYIIGTESSGHGMGVGDIDGDGKLEILLSKGYLKQKTTPYEPWEFIPAWDCGCMASVPILAYDVNGDGICDIIYGNGHGYGLFWLEQKADVKLGFEKHVIDGAAAQYHDLWLVDLDNDGELELVTGKRYRAHCGHDFGDNDPVGLYYYKIVKSTFVRNVIDFGDAGEASGAGIYMWIADTNGDGRLDIVAPGKEGLYLFENLG